MEKEIIEYQVKKNEILDRIKQFESKKSELQKFNSK